jgi:hypothetical protein
VVVGTFGLDNLLVAPKGLAPIHLLPAAGFHQFPSTMTPAQSTVTLRPGAHQDVPFKLLLPRSPSPVDIMFLIDTTSSTDHTIAGLRKDLQAIVNDLATAGLDVQFGLADFRDYDSRIGNMGDGEVHDYPYKLDRRIGPDNAQLAHALSGLISEGGGDLPESDLTALYQSTTGAGQVYRQRHPHRVWHIVPPGEQAGYRSDSLRLAVLATDAPFHREKHYLTPQWGTTMNVLRAAGVHPIGLAVQKVDESNKPGGFPATRDEDALGIATGTLAPRGGVDCNGDLTVDVQQGQPLVCRVPLQQSSNTPLGVVDPNSTVGTINLTPAITTASASIPDYRAIGLAFTGQGNKGIARVIAPRTLPQVNLKSDNVVNFTVRFQCPRTHRAHLYELGINAGAGGRTLTSSAATVACGAVPVPKKPVVPPPAAAVAPVAAVGAAAPPAPGGNPPPNANPNPNPALNANMGFAGQEEEQRQLAYAGADQGVEEDPATEMQMSWFLGGAALLMTAAAAYAARSRFSAAWHRN